MALLWLDLANANCPIWHKLVERALSIYHVPEKIQSLILDYYNNFSLRVSSGIATSTYHSLERDLTISVPLLHNLSSPFALARNMIMKYAEVDCRGHPVRHSLIT